MSTFAEKELQGEQVFNEYGPFWHLYTDGTKMENVFCRDEEKKLVMTAIAVEEKLSEVPVTAFSNTPERPRSAK